MGPLRLDLAVPTRGFDLRLALEVGRETVALVGPSGAGKTTVLRAVAGLVRPARGRIECDGETWFDGERRIDLRPERRSIGLVFQEYALFPHLTVERNVAFGGRDRAHELLERLGIRHLARARPGELSGGERQRVALARALARDPRVLLLDEPLAALDAHTRGSVRAELEQLLRELRLPTLLVTHDFEDAAALADRVGVLVDGELRQLAPPAELVAAPADPFVASLAGGVLLDGVAHALRDGLTEVRLADGTALYSTDAAAGPVSVLVYPWEVSLALDPPADSALNHVRGPVASIVPVANRLRIRVGPLTAEVTAASAERLGIVPGRPVVASFKATATRLLPRFTAAGAGDAAGDT
ncbi:MAG: ABC transporter ATP-binding protein [Actinobacteria bacterium]|nr:MAG: ABC transporter ATP-binding protein [Actinomycetota bacterium]